MTDWQKMDSAPRDGTEVLISGGTYYWDGGIYDEPVPFKGVRIASFTSETYLDHPWQGGNCGGQDEWFWYAPTHWMPVPPPPLTDATDKARRE